jgi:regulator of cell morphogenesis and NO signaling
MTITIDSTIGAIVAEDFRAAQVFHRHDIDFCCRGGRSLDQACQEQGLDPSSVLAEIAAMRASGVEPPDFGTWDAPRLIAHIVGDHHAYVREALPSLIAHTSKIARVHGERHPELFEVVGLVEGVAAEMTTHMLKEEHILFPHIEALAMAIDQGCPPPPSPFGTIENPIRVMETEHESAGDAMARIRQLTHGYQVPDDGCETYRVTMQELDAFEQDLHAHVHLENYILFPKARRLEEGACPPL